MPNKDKTKLYTFVTDNKVSPVYSVSNKILIFFNRLGLIESEKVSNKENIDKNIETLKKQDGTLEYINAAKIGAVDRVIAHKYVKRPIRDGYLYVIDKKGKPTISEYEILAGSLSPIIEELTNVKGDIRKLKQRSENKFVYASLENESLFAYSSTQLTDDYLNDCLSNKDNLQNTLQYVCNLWCIIHTIQVFKLLIFLLFCLFMSCTTVRAIILDSILFLNPSKLLA